MCSTPRPLLLLLACLVVPASLLAQSSSTTTSGPQTPQTATILQQSIAAMTGGAPVTGVTMTGTMSVAIAPGQPGGAPTTDSGTIMLVATATGQGKFIATTSSGTHTEIRDISSGSPTLAVTGTDGVTYAVTTQSALSPHPAWFYPALILTSGLSSSSYASSYIGQETWNGAAAQHIGVWLVYGVSSKSQPGRHDIYLDPSSLLPIGETFMVHPHDGMNPNRPIVPYRGETIDSSEQVTFSDYRQIQGRPVAFHLHISMGTGSPIVITDIQLSSVTFNTGATIASN